MYMALGLIPNTAETVWAWVTPKSLYHKGRGRVIIVQNHPKNCYNIWNIDLHISVYKTLFCRLYFTCPDWFEPLKTKQCGNYPEEMSPALLERATLFRERTRSKTLSVMREAHDACTGFQTPYSRACVFLYLLVAWGIFFLWFEIKTIPIYLQEKLATVYQE